MKEYGFNAVYDLYSPAVKAAQVTEKNMRAILVWMSVHAPSSYPIFPEMDTKEEKADETGPEGSFSFYNEEKGLITACIGDWLILKPNGQFDVLDDYHFGESYAPVSDEVFAKKVREELPGAVDFNQTSWDGETGELTLATMDGVTRTILVGEALTRIAEEDVLRLINKRFEAFAVEKRGDSLTPDDVRRLVNQTLTDRGL